MVLNVCHHFLNSPSVFGSSHATNASGDIMIANIMIAWRTPSSSSVVRAIISTVTSPAKSAPSAKSMAVPANIPLASLTHQAPPDAELSGLVPPEPALVPDDMKLYALAPIAFDRSTMAAHK